MLTALESLGKPAGQEPVFPAQPAEENDDPTEGFGRKAKEPEPEEDKTEGIWKKPELQPEPKPEPKPEPQPDHDNNRFEKENKITGESNNSSGENDEPTEGVVWKTLEQDTDRETDESTVGVWNNEQTQAETEPEKESKPKQQNKEEAWLVPGYQCYCACDNFPLCFQQGKKQRFD